MKKKILFLGLIGLMLTVVLFLAGCGPNCPADADCTVTYYLQGSTWYYYSDSSQYKNCGSRGNESRSGCKVANMRAGYVTARTGTHKCDC